MERTADESFSDGDQGVIAGVCADLARRWRIHPNWLRAGFVVGVLSFWVFALAYAGLALVLPLDAPSGGLGARLRQRFAVAQDRLASALGAVSALSRHWMELRRSVDEAERGRAIAGGALVAVGAYLLLSSFGLLDWLTLGRFFAIGMCLLGLALIAGRRDHRP